MWQIFVGISLVAVTAYILSAVNYVRRVSVLNVRPCSSRWGFWITGHLGDILKGKPMSELKYLLMPYWMDIADKHEMPVLYLPGPLLMKRAVMLVNDPVACRECFSSRHMQDLHKGPEYNTALGLIGDGILASNEEVWQKQRKICDLGFMNSTIKSSVNKSIAVTNLAIEKFKQSKDSNGKIIINAPIETSFIAADTMGHVIFGYDFNAVKAKSASEAPMYHAIKTILHVITLRLSVIEFFPNQEFNTQLAVFNKLVDDVVKSEKKHGAQKAERTLLSQLIEGEYQGERLTDTQIKDNVKSFMFAGQDTTSSALAWGLYYFALYPEIQKKAREEVDKVLGQDKNKPLTYEMVKSDLPYLSNFLRELLRIRPSAVFTKAVMNPMTLPGTEGKSFPVVPGITLHFNPMFIHHNKKYWGEDALEFKPDRWEKLDEEKKDLSLIYFPFSQGHRNCIGQNFAKVEIISVFSKLLQSFEINLTPETKSTPPRLALELTLYPADFTLELTERQ
eukprot:Phypoly_transcript_06545.p1 GENE.Phypoly_transcript_06545~~Phypoly_transcript_06545.p1  ORF type:complete len:506 (+),score=68.68 Phypoly_transcript_06545:251-1768(+)